MDFRTLKFFIVFHDKVYQENTAGFTPKELEDNFIWYAVNEKLPKIYPAWAPVVKEWELAKHNPLMQMNQYFQNSAFFHLYKNQHLIDSKYIGFGQYDMKIDPPSFKKMLQYLDTTFLSTFVGCFLYPFETLGNCVNWDKTFMAPYNAYHGTNFTLASVNKNPLFLLHTFVMPTIHFVDMMKFAEHLMPTVIKSLGWDMTHFAGTMERVFALWILFAIAREKFKKVIKLDGITHLDNQCTTDRAARNSQHTHPPSKVENLKSLLERSNAI